MSDEKGYIKFNCHWTKENPQKHPGLEELIHWRNRLYDASLIGCYKNGIGYGNISMRQEANRFFITGTATGKYEQINHEHITLVTTYHIEGNELTCRGPIKASSESLTHAIIYELNAGISAVVHIHSLALWEKHLNQLPTTSAAVTYGTPAMAAEVKWLFDNTEVKKHGVFVMGGHKEGIIAFGSTIKEAAECILKL